MSKRESVTGWIYVFMHIFGLVFLLNFLNIHVFPHMGFVLDSVTMNLVYYAFGFLFLLVTMFQFWRKSFADLCSNLVRTVVVVIVGYFAYMLLTYIVMLFLSEVLENTTNPNSAQVNEAARLNRNTMLAISVFLGPIVEETLFRGVVFGTLRRKSRILAYVVSSLLFAIYHLWQYMLGGVEPTFFLYLLQYLPAGIVLGACYEQAGSVWCPVFLHMAINFVSITVSLG